MNANHKAGVYRGTVERAPIEAGLRLFVREDGARTLLIPRGFGRIVPFVAGAAFLASAAAPGWLDLDAHAQTASRVLIFLLGIVAFGAILIAAVALPSYAPDVALGIVHRRVLIERKCLALGGHEFDFVEVKRIAISKDSVFTLFGGPREIFHVTLVIGQSACRVETFDTKERAEAFAEALHERLGRHAEVEHCRAKLPRAQSWGLAAIVTAYWMASTGALLYWLTMFPIGSNDETLLSAAALLVAFVVFGIVLHRVARRVSDGVAREGFFAEIGV